MSVNALEVLEGSMVAPHICEGERALADSALSHRLRLASLAIGRAISRSCADLNLTTAQLLYLRQVWREEGLTQRELSHRVDSAESTTTSALRILERRGLVFRKALSGDRRASRVFLTKKGREIEEIVLPIIGDVNKAAVEGLSEAEVEHFGSVLEKIVANVQDYVAPAGSAGRPRSQTGQKSGRRRVPTEA